jgi:sugar lactone lactonase YvrE
VHGVRLALALVAVSVLGTLVVGPGALGMFTGTPVAPVATYSTGQLNAPSPLACRWSAANDVRLTWTNSSPTFALGYDVLRSNTSGSGYALLTSTSSASAVTADDTNPSPPTARFYVVRATHAPSTWTSANSNEVTTTGCADAVTLYAGTGTAGSSGDNGAATAAQLNHPNGIASDASGNVYVADTNGNRIRRIDATTGVITTVAGGGATTACSFSGAATSVSLKNPAGVAVDPANGDVYIADTGNNCVRKLSGTTISQFAGGGATTTCNASGTATSFALNAPAGVAVGASSTVYIADTNANCIRKVTGTSLSYVAGGGGSAACSYAGAASGLTLNKPGGLALDGSGNVFIADTNANCVREVSAGAVSQVAGGGASSACSFSGSATAVTLNHPGALAVDSSGNVFVADTTANCVRKVAGGSVSTILGTGTASYSGDGGYDRVATVNHPGGAGLLPSGDLIIGDTNNNRVRRVVTP